MADEHTTSGVLQLDEHLIARILQLARDDNLVALEIEIEKLDSQNKMDNVSLVTTSLLDKNRRTILHLASQGAVTNVVKYITSTSIFPKHGSTKALAAFLNQEDNTGETAFHVAVRTGQIGLLAILTNQGAAMDTTDNL
ncbi:Uu.00g026160.m01.CDS01 [Anthostomella pinea]|uniref:Uu.00g026160.m01.CDS01 n=1 Tax=Anthostomella pinea TaxID=933095 RepID=A0AAI8V2P0_9PEZI|nr:Uu.00g026160.m01.CDS01 [Anthostomella pinea]